MYAGAGKNTVHEPHLITFEIPRPLDTHKQPPGSISSFYLQLHSDPIIPLLSYSDRRCSKSSGKTITLELRLPRCSPIPNNRYGTRTK